MPTKQEDGYLLIEEVQVDEGYEDENLHYITLWVADGLGSKVRSAKIPVPDGPRWRDKKREIADEISDPRKIPNTNINCHSIFGVFLIK